MKIAFLGNFNVDYTSESHYIKTLRKLGHEVYPLQEGVDQIETILDRASKMEMFLWVHTHGWHTKGMAEGLEILKERGIPTVGYHLDLWKGLKREIDLESDPYWKIEYFFSVDNLMVDYLNSRDDLPKAFYLPAGVFEDECYIGTKNTRYMHDVIFVGSKAYHPEWPYRPQLIEWLEKTYGSRFALYGRDGKGIIRGEQLNDLYASAKVVVGDTLCKNFDYPFYLSDRIFETTGRGGFIIHPYIHGISDLFALPEYQFNAKGKQLDTFDTSKAEIITYPFNEFEYLKYLIDYYIKNDEERESIRLRGFQKTKLNHTYTNRLNYLVQTIQNEKLSK